VSAPAEDIYAWPGDVLTLVRIPQTFSVFGATGQNVSVELQRRRIDAGRGAGQGGGIAGPARRSDMGLPFSVRAARYRRCSQRSPLATGPSGRSPIVYRLDLSDASGYFFAQRFPVDDKDIIYVANARLNELQKFFTLLNTLTGTG